MPCGKNEFARSYAHHRCKNVHKFRHDSQDCSHCLHHQSVVDWALATEQCLQSNLSALAQQWADKMATMHLSEPDSQHCLMFERDGLSILNDCYKASMPLLCASMTNDSSRLVRDLNKVLNIFTKDEYYSGVVHQQMRDLLTSCEHENAVNIANTVAPPSLTKTLFCSTASDDKTNHLLRIAQIMGNDVSEYSYASKVDVNDNGQSISSSKCMEAAPTPLALLNNYKLIQWSRGSKVIPVGLINGKYIQKTLTATNILTFFTFEAEYSQNGSDTCGNGKREAGELCDLFANTGIPSLGCNDKCQPFEGYECSTNKLEHSVCKPTECGDGKRTSNEECDSANMEGCGNCIKEAGYICTANEYGRTSECSKALQINSTPHSDTSTTNQQSSSPTPSPSATSAQNQNLMATSSGRSSLRPSRTYTLLSGLLPVLAGMLVGHTYLVAHR